MFLSTHSDRGANWDRQLAFLHASGLSTHDHAVALSLTERRLEEASAGHSDARRQCGVSNVRYTEACGSETRESIMGGGMLWYVAGAWLP